MAKTRAQLNKAVRQESIREQLSAGGHLQHVVEMAGNLSNLDKDMDSVQVQRLRAAIDAKLRLVGKYLPDLKSIEVAGEGGGNITVQISALDAEL